jgi:hypothetical protein
MRKIVTRGLYTYMDGMCPGTNFAGNVEMNEPLKQDKSKSLEGLRVDEYGNEEAKLGYRLKFTAWQKIISHRKQRHLRLGIHHRVY